MKSLFLLTLSLLIWNSGFSQNKYKSPHKEIGKINYKTGPEWWSPSLYSDSGYVLVEKRFLNKTKETFINIRFSLSRTLEGANPKEIKINFTDGSFIQEENSQIQIDSTGFLNYTYSTTLFITNKNTIIFKSKKIKSYTIAGITETLKAGSATELIKYLTWIEKAR